MTPTFLTRSRLSPIRRLSAAECELLEYSGPLLLARRENRFIFGPWRPTSAVLVTTHQSTSQPARVVMACTADQLRERGIDPEAPTPRPL